MKPFDVYPLFNITLVKGQGSYLWDEKGKKYLDLYGGHAVISVGHSHPVYTEQVDQQLRQIGFYSNSVQIPQQRSLAAKLGRQSGYEDYDLFLCNSGAEANENAIKLASFHTGRKKIIAFSGSFHGRTSLALEATDDRSISAPVNLSGKVSFLPFNDISALDQITEESACVIIEGIQGVGGIQVPDTGFLEKLQKQCKSTGTLLILDEIQSGYGRTGKFFAHQHAGIQPDLITVAKGMGNGFPVGGVLISPEILPKKGMLGTTFGGSHLACAAAIAVLDIIEKEQLLRNAQKAGEYLQSKLLKIPGIAALRGRGLMLGLDTLVDANLVRKQLLDEHGIFTGYSSSTKTIRLLPPLNITKAEADLLLTALKHVLQTQTLIA